MTLLLQRWIQLKSKTVCEQSTQHHKFEKKVTNFRIFVGTLRAGIDGFSFVFVFGVVASRERRHEVPEYVVDVGLGNHSAQQPCERLRISEKKCRHWGGRQTGPESTIWLSRRSEVAPWTRHNLTLLLGSGWKTTFNSSSLRTKQSLSSPAERILAKLLCAGSFALWHATISDRDVEWRMREHLNARWRQQRNCYSRAWTSVSTWTGRDGAADTTRWKRLKKFYSN